MRIDSHTHIMVRDSALVPGRHSEPKRDITAEELLALFDKHEITHGVLTQPSFYGTDNSLMLEALKCHPERLRGTAIVAPEIPEQELDALYRAGIRGLRLNWLRQNDVPNPAGTAYQRLFSLARERGLHIELYIEGHKMKQVLPPIQASGAAVVVDHFGSPEPESGITGEGFKAVLAGMSAGNTWVKLSAPYRLGGAPAAPYVRALLQAGGPSQLMWGSDWPWVSHEGTQSYERCLADFESWIPDPQQRTAIWCDTPRRLFGF
ncbi:amidohydrolase [Herbaspirillum sp. RV1423]|uniref:amidohydrolase family protein n=1 Tax=Herbaspirillum sp. RV1423 TaxID=1443993 RepID=UPI0018CC69BE|nr:amidohydrolase family protein [Herbaspirillum sp. RV1423]